MHPPQQHPQRAAETAPVVPAVARWGLGGRTREEKTISFSGSEVGACAERPPSRLRGGRRLVGVGWRTVSPSVWGDVGGSVS